MLIYLGDSEVPLRGDLIVRLVLRSDLTPVPATVELEVRRAAETEALMVEGGKVRIGHDQIEFELIKMEGDRGQAAVQGDRPLATLTATGMLASCSAIARLLQRSVIREGAQLGEIYRACGAQLRIERDFPVAQFSAFKGMAPSFEIAKALQEEAGVLVLTGNKVTFRRLAELVAEPAVQSFTEAATEALQSSFLERHAVPFAYSTAVAGGMLAGRTESARGARYRPRADQRIVNNLSTALIQRRKVRNAVATDYTAGTRVDVGGKPHIVVTAAHVFEYGTQGEQYTQLWLGEFVR